MAIYYIEMSCENISNDYVLNIVWYKEMSTKTVQLKLIDLK